MSNFFGISVAPEIAAAVVKIDAIKADTGPIRNDVTAIHDTNLPAVKADTGPIRNDVTAIHDIMLPSVKVDTAALRNDVTDIHDTDLPAVKTDTGAIRNDVDTIDAIVDAIKIKTDATPQLVRGTILEADLSTTSASLVEICNVTGAGKLIGLSVYCTDGADTVQTQFILDGKTFTAITHTGDTVQQLILLDPSGYAGGLQLRKIPVTSADQNLINIDFDTSLVVKLARSAGSAAAVLGQVYYTLDGF